MLARYGGDEFVVLLPETGVRGAREVAERIRRSVESTGLKVRDTIVPTTVSLGVASYPDDGVDLSLLLDKADKAMYRSKQGGRNRSTHSSTDIARPACTRRRFGSSTAARNRLGAEPAALNVLSSLAERSADAASGRRPGLK